MSKTDKIKIELGKNSYNIVIGNALTTKLPEYFLEVF